MTPTAKRSLASRVVHAGASANPSGALSMPIFQSSTFRLEDAAHGARQSATIAPADFYTRWGNPTVRALEVAVAELEGGEAALAFASGMAAGSTAVLSHLSSGDHVVAADTLYAGMTELFSRMLPRFGITTTFVPAHDLAAFEEAIRPATKLVYVETPANPTLQITDLGGVSAIARARGVVTMADNTWACPINQRPLELGIDVVVHSATKYLGGHSDVISGAVVGSRAFIDRLWSELKLLGGCPGPHDAWLVLRGLKTLAVRVSRQNETAAVLAQYLAGHPRVQRVHYPGLADHPGHVVARRQMDGFGGMLAFEVAGGSEAGRKLLESLRLITHAVSLGGTETLATHPASTTHASLTPEERARAGIRGGLVRLSVGLEDADDLRDDLAQALGQAGC